MIEHLLGQIQMVQMLGLRLQSNEMQFLGIALLWDFTALSEKLRIAKWSISQLELGLASRLLRQECKKTGECMPWSHRVMSICLM